MSKYLFAALLFCMTTVSARSLSDRIITSDGFAGIKIGMNKSEVERASGMTLFGARPPFTIGCYVTENSLSLDKGIQFTFEKGHLVRIDITPRGRAAISARTANGSGFNTSQSELIKRYGSNIKIYLAPYFDHEAKEAEHYLKLKDSVDDKSIIFVVKNDSVERIMIGTDAFVDNPEPCL